MQALLIGPLQVVKGQDQRLLRRTGADQFDHRIVESAAIVPAAFCLAGPRTTIGAKQRQFVPHRRSERLVELGDLRQRASAQQVRPYGEVERALGPPPTRHQADRVILADIPEEAVEQMAFADPGLADCDDQAAAPFPGLRQTLVQGPQLLRSTHHDRTRARHCCAARDRRRPGAVRLERPFHVGRLGGTLLENAPVERVRFIVGRNPQLTLEKVVALAVLVQRRGAHPAGHVKAHQTSVHVLPIAVDPERALSRLDGSG